MLLPTTLAGQKFGRWTVMGFCHKDKYSHYFWKCSCECGNQKSIVSHTLVGGQSKSCGCLQREIAIDSSTKYHYNENVFENIDSEEKAYWLGFIAADGCIKNGKILSFGLSGDDCQHLQKFLIFVGSGRIRNYQTKYIRNGSASNEFSTVSCIDVLSRKMCQDLRKYSITERKSLTLNPLLDFDLDLHRHFWRGMIDGDGCLIWAKTDNYKYPRIILHGTRDVIIKFKNFFSINNKMSGRGNIWGVQQTGTNAIQTIMELYGDANFYLDRKYALALEMINKSRIRVN